MKGIWLLAGAFGLAAPALTSSEVRAADARTVTSNDRTTERRIKFQDLPASVKDGIRDRIGRDADNVTEVTKVVRGNRTMYRALVETREGVTLLFLDADGTTLDVQQAKDYGRDQVPWDKLPAPVQRTLNEERGNGANRGDIQRITIVRRGNTRYYTADITDRDGLRVVRVDEDGRAQEDTDTVRYLSTQGRDRDDDRFVDDRTDGDWVNLKYDDLPRPVQRAFDEVRGTKELARVRKLSSKSRGVRYMGVIADRDRDRRIIVDDNGRVLSDRGLDEAASGGNRPAVRDNDRDRPAARDNDRDAASLRYNDLPDRVQKAFDKLRDHRELAHIRKLTGGNQVRYQAVIADGQRDRRVIVSETGEVLEDRRMDRP